MYLLVIHNNYNIVCLFAKYSDVIYCPGMYGFLAVCVLIDIMIFLFLDYKYTEITLTISMSL